jgi:hypothetical protein
MKTFVAVLSISLLSLLFLSCQKEVDETIIESVNNDTTWITKLVSLDTTQPSGQDTGMVANYRYDAAKRLYTYDFTEFDLNNIQYTADYKFHYRNNTDTLPYMLTGSFRYNTDTDTTFFFYQQRFLYQLFWRSCRLALGKCLFNSWQ